ncbi:MAG: hypothetical protein ACLPID_08660 [Beijerinckiaceae bacterium]
MTMGDIEQLARVLSQQSGDAAERWHAREGKAAAILADVKRLQEKIAAQDSVLEAICADTDDYLDLCVGISAWRESDDDGFRADDYPVAGEIWRVHKSDADPFPSRPHAHCVGGSKKVVGCKLHLGTAQLYKGRTALGRFLVPRQFERLIDLIKPKFPGLVLPLPVRD